MIQKFMILEDHKFSWTEVDSNEVAINSRVLNSFSKNRLTATQKNMQNLIA